MARSVLCALIGTYKHVRANSPCHAGPCIPFHANARLTRSPAAIDASTSLHRSQPHPEHTSLFKLPHQRVTNNCVSSTRAYRSGAKDLTLNFHEVKMAGLASFAPAHPRSPQGPHHTLDSTSAQPESNLQTTARLAGIILADRSGK